jgi:hypothetical protein
MAYNLVMMTLADGSVIDTQNLPPGQRMCYYCMHLHEAELINTLPVGKHHWRMMKHGDPERISCVGCVAHELPEHHDHVRSLHAAWDPRVTGRPPPAGA